MRFAAYAGASVFLASAVVLRALQERPNFYSAAVYLSQSNACIMILSNLILLSVFTCMVALQRLLYGPLRPLEVEVLYEKAWYAITETCLAMTIFRDEIGGWFIVMFVSLLIGKGWGWLGEGRVEALEQQPPVNPRLFHTRLVTSLTISVLFACGMFKYCLQTVLRQARPDMMVMFSFEFAILMVGALSTACRYILTTIEITVINKQTRARIEERRLELRASIENARRAALEAGTDPELAVAGFPAEDTAEDIDPDVPGWESKGRWMFYLNLTTDLFKLIIYLIFFTILLAFYGLPIHIMRDVFMTARSFVQRLASFARYRNATRDMNDRYTDATRDDISREDVCIVCREEMIPWAEQIERSQNGIANGTRRRPPDERTRPKKLPCGHVLHFSCLRSWLERQQNCPTCRRPVIAVNRNLPATAGQAPANGAAQLGAAGNRAVPGAPANRARFFNLGPLRFGFGMGQANFFQDPNNPQVMAGQVPRNVQQYGFGIRFGRAPAAQPQPQTRPQAQNRNQPSTSSEVASSIQTQLDQMEQQLSREIDTLRTTQEQLHFVRMLQRQLVRIRVTQANNANLTPAWTPTMLTPSTQQAHPNSVGSGQYYGAARGGSLLGAGDPNLPQGLQLPPGWAFLPMRRLEAPEIQRVMARVNAPASPSTSWPTSTYGEASTTHGTHTRQSRHGPRNASTQNSGRRASATANRERASRSSRASSRQETSTSTPSTSNAPNSFPEPLLTPAFPSPGEVNNTGSIFVYPTQEAARNQAQQSSSADNGNGQESEGGSSSSLPLEPGPILSMSEGSSEAPGVNDSVQSLEPNLSESPSRVAGVNESTQSQEASSSFAAIDGSSKTTGADGNVTEGLRERVVRSDGVVGESGESSGSAGQHSESVVTPEEEEESSRHANKGKARAATVEDCPDEYD